MDGKKSFILYCDIISTVEKLPDEQAGKLFKIILEYVNDKNPKIEDMLLQIAFEPIKQQLKRDLIKWKNYIEKQSINGAKGGRPPKSQNNPEKGLGYLDNPEKPKKADSVTVIGTVTDSVSDNTEKPKDFLKRNIEIQLQELHKKSKLSDDEFELSLIQWSLKCEEAGWEYTDFDKDLKRLRAGFEKWVNSWVQNKKNKSQRINGKPEEPRKNLPFL